jgi:hemerythrin
MEEWMEWKVGYDIGIDSIDNQHRQLVAIISRLEASLSTASENKEMGNALKFLVDYTKQHFSEEEAFMQEVGSPDYDHHKKLHKDLIQELMEMLLKLKRGKTIQPRELIRFLTDWLVNHILDEDKKIGEFVAGQKEMTASTETFRPEPTETALVKKLQKLKTLCEKKLISGDDFKAKKTEFLTKYSAVDTSTNVTTVGQKLSFLGVLQKEHLITKEEEKEHRAILFNQVDIEDFLRTMPGIEEKLLYLKSILEEGVITGEVYESHKTKLLMEL